MAATFTGLKLQGSIGKFGKIDLSDIDNFVELPDGKVISGTETGSLLMWEGHFIKCRFTQLGGAPCHSGNITFLQFDRSEQCVISASIDGFIRWWDFTAIDAAEVDSDHSMDFELLPMAEFFIGTGLGVKAMADSGLLPSGDRRFFVVLDTNGNLQTITVSMLKREEEETLKLCDAVLSMKEQQQSMESKADFAVDQNERYVIDRSSFEQFHSSAITGLATCPIDHLAASCSSDGSIRCFDYQKRKLVAFRQFSTGATCLRWMPQSLDYTGRMLVVGFADGAIRILELSEEGVSKEEKTELTFLRRMVFKPHNAAVTEISFNDNGELVATAGKDGIIFFLQSSPVTENAAPWNPIRFLTISPVGPNGKAPACVEKISWSPTGSTVLCTCTDGVLRAVDLLTMGQDINYGFTAETVVSYEAFYPISEIAIKVPVLAGNKSASMAVLPQSPTKTSKADTNFAEPSEENKEGAAPPESPTKASKQEADVSMMPVKVTHALYSFNRASGGFVVAATLGNKHFLFECDVHDEKPIRELPMGLYSVDGKDLVKNPLPLTFNYSMSKNFLLVGTSDGSVVIRPSDYLEIFARNLSHNNSVGTAFVASSFDDRFTLSAGKDGCVVVNRVRLDIFHERATNLFKDLDAGVYSTDLYKPLPKNPAPEPSYIDFVSTVSEFPEFDLFSPHLSGKKEANILKKDLAPQVEEKVDLAANAYSIQDNRLKMEEDAKKEAAEELKNRVRASVKALQKDYEKLQMENETVPESVRLTAEEMMVDKEFFDLLVKQGAAMIDEVHKECAYEAEKAEKLHLRLRERLTQNLLVEEMSLSAFNQDASSTRNARSIVKSLRTKALDPFISNVLKEIQSIMRQTEIKESEQRANEIAYRKALETVDEMKSRLSRKDAEDHLGKLDNFGGNKEQHGDGSESTAVSRRLKRKERKDVIKKHLAEKPKEDEDDKRDVQAIKLAEKTIGDFKLKCSEDYEVPEEQRINAVKKMRQMAMLEESMVTMRLQFNERFLMLRNVKRQMVYTVRRDNARIRAIDEELGQSHLSENLWEPVFDPDEFPDDADEVTPTELAQFQQTRAKVSWEKAPAPKHSVITGSKLEVGKSFKTGNYEVVNKSAVDRNLKVLENYLSDEALINFTPPRDEEPKYYEASDSILTAFVRDSRSAEAKRLQELEATVPILKQVKEGMKARMRVKHCSEIQELLNSDRKRKLEFERAMIISKMNENVVAFREAVDELRTDRHTVIADLKLAELKLLVLCQEYKLLQTFESRDNALQQKQIRCKGEETEISTLTSENRSKLEAKQEELQHWNDKVAQLMQEFKIMLPDSHPYVETLSKIFKKKVKRSKHGDDENEDDDYNDDPDEDADDDGDDDDEEIEDICPPGCEQTFFERILDLREKKLDTEDITVEIQKNIDDLRKTIDRLKQREKQIVKDGIQTELEVQQFQLQKQAALNQIPVVVPLRIGQLYMFESSGKLTGPTDGPAIANDDDSVYTRDTDLLRNPDKRSLVANVELKSHTLFTVKNLVRLKERIHELHHEIDDSKEEFKQLHKERSNLKRERESQMAQIELWSARCRDLQMLKFGREIDLDELEASSDRSKELEIEAQLKEEEEIFKAKAAKLLKEAHILQERLSGVTHANTKLLNEVADLTEAKLLISRELNAPNQVISQPTKLDNFREMEENKRIAAYVQFQAKELESLRAELNMLKRKEAPPVLANLPAPPVDGQPRRQTGDLVLPPIPTSKGATGR